MSLIKFIGSSNNEYIEVNLSLDSLGRVKISFKDKENIPTENILFKGFVELNEHNYLKQSDFSDMNYLYRKIDATTYILTKDKDDVYTEPENEDYPAFVPENRVLSVEEVRIIKISNLSHTCNLQIINGVYINIDGVLEHFSYTEEDQTNIKELFDLAVQTNMPLYYHSDGNSCKLYSVAQIMELYTTSAMNKMHHITYFNQLKMYLNSIDDPDVINTIEYGHTLTGEYLDTYNAAMAQAKIGIETLLKVG